MRQSVPPEYYDRPYLGDDAYVGAHFDSWSSTGVRAGEADRFTADVLVAVGVPVGGRSPDGGAGDPAHRAEALNALLEAVRPDRDLVSTNRSRWPLSGRPKFGVEAVLLHEFAAGDLQVRSPRQRLCRGAVRAEDSFVEQYLGGGALDAFGGAAITSS